MGTEGLAARRLPEVGTTDVGRTGSGPKVLGVGV